MNARKGGNGIVREKEEISAFQEAPPISILRALSENALSFLHGDIKEMVWAQHDE